MFKNKAFVTLFSTGIVFGFSFSAILLMNRAVRIDDVESGKNVPEDAYCKQFSFDDNSFEDIVKEKLNVTNLESNISMSPLAGFPMRSVPEKWTALSDALKMDRIYVIELSFKGNLLLMVTFLIKPLSDNKKYLYLSSIIVGDELRNRGIGSLALCYCKYLTQKHNLAGILLEASADNSSEKASLENFYRKNLFIAEGKYFVYPNISYKPQA